MSGEASVRQIYEFRAISGNKVAPGAAQHGKFVKWDDASKTFAYETLTIPTIPEIPDDNYLAEVNRTGQYGQFIMADGTIYYLDLTNTTVFDPDLPGDTKVLFDANDSIAGLASFTYDYTNNKLRFQGTPLMFDLTNGTEGTYKEGLKYNGLYSWSVGHGASSLNGGSYNINLGYRAGHGLSTGSLRNTIVGAYAGEVSALTTTGAVYIGAYAGRYETASNKFFLDNTDHANTATARTNSFLYADLDSERRLYVRDSLALTKEIKVGDSGLSDAAGASLVSTIGGSLIHIIDTGGGVYKPQYHDGTIWQDFANNTDVYLSNVAYLSGNLTFTLSDTSTIGPIDISGVNTTVFATSLSSPSTGKTATSDYGYIQISNNSFTNNEGFTHVYKNATAGGLRWFDSFSELNVPGAVKLASKASYGASDGVINYDGTHFYGRLSSTWVQLDNAELGEGVNIGEGTYEIYKQKNVEGDLEFRTIDEIPYENVLNPYGRITFDNTTNTDLILIGTTAELNYLASAGGTYSLVGTKVGESLPVKGLSAGAGITIVDNTTHLTVSSSAASATGTNNGGASEVYIDGTAPDFEFRTLDAIDNRITIAEETTNTIDFSLNLALDVDNIALTSTPATSAGIFESYDDTSDPTAPVLRFRPLINLDGTVVITQNANDEIVLSATTGAVPASYTGSQLCATAGSVQIFKQLNVNDFEFRGLILGDHISTADETLNCVTLDVADITVTSISNDLLSVDLIELGTGGFDIKHKGILAGDAMSITDDATDLTFAVASSTLGTGVSVWKNLDLEFKSITASGDHVTVSANADGLHVDIDVDDIILSYIGDPDVADPYTSQEIMQLNADNWTVEYKGIGVRDTSGLTIGEEVNGTYKDIVIDQPILIPKFSFITTPAFTPGTPTTQGLLSFTTGYNSDVRDGSGVSTNTMFNLNIGSGLGYNSGTNTLYANVSSAGITDDYAVRFLDVIETDTEYTIQFILDNSLGTDASFVPIDLDSGGPVVTYDYLTIEKYQLVVADYTDIAGSTGDLGGVKVYSPDIVWTNATQNNLALDIVTGRLNLPYELVTYNEQNELYDAGNSAGINTKRDQARANIGAAYINGVSTEDFNTDDLNVSGIITATDTVNTHTIGNLELESARIASSTGIIMVSNNDSETTKITLVSNAINITVSTSSTSRVNIYDELGNKMFLFDVTTGDLYVKGSVKMGGTFEAFSTAAQSI